MKRNQKIFQVSLRYGIISRVGKILTLSTKLKIVTLLGKKSIKENWKGNKCAYDIRQTLEYGAFFVIPLDGQFMRCVHVFR